MNNNYQKMTLYSLIVRSFLALVVFVACPELAVAQLSDTERQGFLEQAERQASPLVQQLFTALGQHGCQGVTKEEWQSVLQDTVSEKMRFFLLLTHSRCLLSSNTHFREAITTAQEALSIIPDNYTALWVLGQAHFQLGEDEEAIKAFQQVEALEGPHPAGLYDQLGFSKFRMASGPFMLARKPEREALLRESEAYFEEAIRLAPCDPSYQNHLAHTFSSQGRFEEAVETMREAIALVPAFDELNEQEKTFALADYYVNLGQMYAFRQKWDEAEEWINKGINLFPPGRIRDHLELLGKQSLLGKEKFFPQKDLEQAETLGPQHPNYHYHRATTFLSQGRVDDATKTMGEAIAMVPGFDKWNEQQKTLALADYHVYLGELHVYQQKWDEAEAMINKGINLAPSGKFRERLEVRGEALLMGKERFFNPWPQDSEEQQTAGTN